MMKYCQQCDLELSEAFKYCPSCGGQTSAAPATAQHPAKATVQLPHCPSCGETFDAKWSFCVKCGHRLQSATVATQQSEAMPTGETTVTDLPSTLTQPPVSSSWSASSDSPLRATTAPLSAAERYPYQSPVQERDLPASYHQAPLRAEPLVPSKPSLTRKEAPTLTMLESYGEVQTTPVGER